MVEVRLKKKLLKEWSSQSLLNQAVVIPVLGIKKYSSADELKKSDGKYDLFCKYVNFKEEYRALIYKGKLISLNERIPIEAEIWLLILKKLMIKLNSSARKWKNQLLWKESENDH